MRDGVLPSGDERDDAISEFPLPRTRSDLLPTCYPDGSSYRLYRLGLNPHLLTRHDAGNKIKMNFRVVWKRLEG